MIIFLIFCSHAMANPDVEMLIDKANELKLYNDKQWLNLLHFNQNKIDMKNIFTLDGRSEIDSESFFYAIDGKTNPKAEMEATIRAFFQEVESINVPEQFIKKIEYINSKSNTKLPLRSSKKEDYHALCRFPARFEFIDSRLDLSSVKSLPSLACKEYKDIYKYISPKSLTMVFPSAHINSPASMFGHTFLLLNSSFDSRLLSFAINYAALADASQENFFLFAIKGLVGSYPGTYSILPYYDKIKEYSDGENRDIWEFDLNFTQDEVERIYKHIWELNDVWVDYYFFDENCSYAMLWLLEVGRPGLELRNKFTYQVMPTESIFALEDLGIIKQHTYRPSKRSVILSYESYLDFKEVNVAKQIANGEIESNSTSNTYILESALEYAEYQFLKQDLDREKYISIAHNIATHRSKFHINQKPFIHTPFSPLQANQSFSFQIYGGSVSDEYGKGGIIGVDVRPTYHDISENDSGFLRGAGIEFLKFNAYTNKKNVYINEFKIINVTSLGFISKFFTPLSYYMGMGFDRWGLRSDLKYYINGGIGASTDFGWGYTYILFSPEFRDLGISLGITTGASFQPHRDFKISLTHQIKSYNDKRFIDTFGNILNLEANYQLALNLSLGLNYKIQLLPLGHIDRKSLNVGLKIYM